MAKELTTIEKFIALPDSEKDARVAKYERGIPFSRTKPLTPAQRKQWRRIQGKLLGRPVVGRGAKVVAVTIERDLLARADRFARQHRLKRAQMIAQGLELVMKKAG